MKPEYQFLKKHVDRTNLGQHEGYNGFIVTSSGFLGQFADWKSEFPDCIPIGVCKESRPKLDHSGTFMAMVFEDSEGRRYFVHVPACWVDEAEVEHKGPKAMEEAKMAFYAAHP